MPATVQLRDTTTGQPHTIPISELDSALASGKYEQYEGSVVNTERLGTQTRVNPKEATGMLAGGEGFVDPNIIGAQQGEATQRKSFNNIEDKALTFAEGAVDALSFGLVHERGDVADVRREVNSGSALVGEIAGTALGLKLPGPLHSIASGGEITGRMAAKAIFGTSGRAAEIGARTFGEAGVGAALMGAGATGHQVWDALLENKPLAAEAIIHEVGMGALLGSGMGLLSGVFGRAANRGSTAIGADIDGFLGKAGTHFDSSIKELDTVLDQHGSRIGVLQQAVDDGLIPKTLLPERESALLDAQVAQKKLNALGSATDALNADADAANKWSKAAEDYHQKISKLDRLMTPKLSEVAGTPVEPGKPIQGPNPPPGDILTPHDTTSEEAIGLNDRMAKSAELRQQYKELHGKDWEPVAPADGGTPITPSGLESNLGGKVTPISGDVTGVGKRVANKTIDIESNPHLIESSRKIGDFTDVNLNKHPELIESEGHANSPELTSLKEKLAGVDRNVTGVKESNSAEQNANAFADSLSKFNEQLKIFDKDPIKDLQLAHNKGKLERHEQYRKLIDDWSNESRRFNHGTPAGRAISNIEQSFADLHIESNGRLDAAGSLEVAKAAGFTKALGPIGDRFQQAWSLRHISNAAADASRVSVKGLLDKKSLTSKAIDYAKRRVGGKIGAAIGGALIGHEIGGGEAGYYLGAALATGYIGFGGKIAGSIGKLTQQIADVGDVLLKGRRATMASRAIAGNRPWAYSDKGPIKDPIERIEEIQHLAAHPEMILAKVTKSSGDLSAVHPEIANLLTKVAEHRIMALSVKAPKFVMDTWGNPMKPAIGEMRKFLEYENALNDFPSALNAIKSGSVTRSMADGIRDGWPAFSQKLTAKLLDDPTRLQALPPSSLRSIELITGTNLTKLGDGKFIERQQSSWVLAGQQQEQNNQPGKPQAFRINSKHVPGTGPTPTQSINGRAPGN